MNDIERILVVSRSTKHCQKAVHYGVSLAKKFEAELYVLHVIHNPFGLEGWALPIPSLQVLEEEYERIQQEARSDLDKMIESETTEGLSVHVMIGHGEPQEEVMRVVEEKKIDVLIMLAHQEGRIEHFLFGRGNDEIMRRLPCSILLVKKEPEPVAY
jgi:nucleotide-binding universal stress UspA family protein